VTTKTTDNHMRWMSPLQHNYRSRYSMMTQKYEYYTGVMIYNILNHLVHLKKTNLTKL